MDADGTMKPQYVTGDNGVEHDHKVAMSLHKWNKDAEANTVYNGQTITMRVGTAPDKSDAQVKSQVTILHSSILMTVGNDHRWLSTRLGQQCVR
eukprot:1625148-Amphidinium_carterae.1